MMAIFVFLSFCLFDFLSFYLFRLFDADESGNIELDEMFEIVATFYDMEVKIFETQAGRQKDVCVFLVHEDENIIKIRR